MRSISGAIDALRALPQPVIARVAAVCMGVGLDGPTLALRMTKRLPEPRFERVLILGCAFDSLLAVDLLTFHELM
jgi:hypothetical protein